MEYRGDGLIPFIKLERKILFRESDKIKMLWIMSRPRKTLQI
ncbi:hypothetical protein FM107_13795 [Sphingobacterium sp. JB170]|nr:hypothetical protein FM107_13795 [Sphingobacterium sp. JB170]